ncbi:hypothetical protein J2S43_005234 [Catenuloplanes nepalensis]|uniref:Uncharacterized protein n=1 Tax=Catenuloplanes nepalensis TaxID=587533 RepID=A0ABT9MZ49_9ACTN|nr:hypothetical protein [Catenuloplanes nepalensis]MDP9796722.1 hypothetical protein [Catenuloplanes nepalensis]
MTPFSGDEYEPWTPSASPADDDAPPPMPRRSFTPRRPWASRTWYRPAPGTPCYCGCRPRP